MVALSKYFSAILNQHRMDCKDILHPNSGCTYFILDNSIPIVIGSAQFFFPLYFIPLLASPQNITRQKVLEVFRVYANSVQTSSLTVISSFLTICLQSKYTGKYGYWRLVPLPAIVGGLTIFFASDKVSSLFGHAASIVIFDMLTRDGSVWPLKQLYHSNILRTMLFMTLSGIIMDSLYMDTSSAFWLFHPTKTRVKAAKNPHEICHHENTCDTYATQVFKKYLILGIALEFAKCVFSNITLIGSRPIEGLYRSIRNININFLLFISGYPTLTNILNCALNRNNQMTPRLNQFLAAVLGGFPFYFYANEMPILSHTLVTAIEALWLRYLKNPDYDSIEHRRIKSIPFAKIIYIFGGAYMYAGRLFYPWLAPKFLHRLIELLTNHRFDDIAERIHSKWIHDAAAVVQIVGQN